MVHFVLPSSLVFIGVAFESLMLSFVTFLTNPQFHVDGYHYHLRDQPSVIESTTGLPLNVFHIPNASEDDKGGHYNLGQSNDGHQLVQHLHTQLLHPQLLRRLLRRLLRILLCTLFTQHDKLLSFSLLR